MDKDFDLPQLPPSLSLEELLAKAEKEEIAKADPAKLEDPAPFDEDAVNKLLGTDDIKPTRKIKRDVKMTEEMLMSDTGFKYLIREVKRQKFRGSGHERHDLAKLMEIIQLWGHQLLPKMAFKDFLIQSNKICKQRRIKMGIITEEIQNQQPEPEVESENEVVEEAAQDISTQQKELIESNKQMALEKLAKRKEERELAKKRERELEEENIARMIAESGHLFAE
ncbi:hypothetical protein HDV06_001630 [Boothiomyces sp. JEL0866]|nr:hypothetical protein HDV06_001630 [Boothiomyces sp. JEL0866]